jgi:transcriptional regulator with XRE-family HTH domain
MSKAQTAKRSDASEAAFDKEVGRRLHEMRTARGFSVEDIASKLNVSYQQMRKYEQGVNRISSARLHLLATIYEVDITVFFGDAALNDALSPDSDAPSQKRRLLASFDQLSNRARAALVEMSELLVGNASGEANSPNSPDE